MGSKRPRRGSPFPGGHRVGPLCLYMYMRNSGRIPLMPSEKYFAFAVPAIFRVLPVLRYRRLYLMLDFSDCNWCDFRLAELPVEFLQARLFESRPFADACFYLLA
jgi:hypothetical protein